MSKKPSLLETHPEVAKEALGWDPSNFSHGSDKKMDWRCQLGHDYVAAIKHRTFSNSGCPYCANQKLLTGFNDLKTAAPDLAEEAHGWDPSTEFSSSVRVRQWKCKADHVFEATIRNRRRGDGCPYCSGRRVTKGKNDLRTTNPALASQIIDLDPTTVSAGSATKVTWECTFGHRWKTSIANRALSGTECPVCSGQKLLIGFNDLATKFPEIASEADGWDTSQILAGSHAQKDWKCAKGHRWKTSIDHRTNKLSGCPFCSGRNAIPGENDLATLYPEIAVQAVDWDPSTTLPNSAKRVKWKCSLNHQWSSVIYARVSSKFEGCPYCSGKSVLAGFNDLQTVNPSLAAEALDWDTTRFGAGSGAKKKWKCPEGHIWSAVISSRNSGNGCPTCAKTGFDPNKDGWLYFLEHDDWEMLQIGITNVPDGRLALHRRLGWKLLELRGPMNGDLARQWETDILRMLRKTNAELGNSKIAGHFSGFTESWMKASYPAKSLKELMESVRNQDWQ
jgi:DNA-directed RNA polymerase subunit RPC12/RpoP